VALLEEDVEELEEKDETLENGEEALEEAPGENDEAEELLSTAGPQWVQLSLISSQHSVLQDPVTSTHCPPCKQHPSVHALPQPS